MIELVASAKLPDAGVVPAGLFILACLAVLLYWTAVAVRDAIRDWRQ